MNGQTFCLARFSKRTLLIRATGPPRMLRRNPVRCEGTQNVLSQRRLMMTETLAPPPFCSIAEARVRIVLTGKNRLFAAHKSL